MKRWEQLERQRRKAARELLSSESVASTNQSNVARSDTTRRGSLFWTGARSRKPAPGSHPLSTADVGDLSPSAEDFGLPPESEELAVVRVRPPDDDLTKSRESFITRHKPSSSLDSHVSDSSAATITPSDPKSQPTDPISTVSTSSDPNSDPFVDPVTRSQIRKGKQTPRTMSRTRTSSGDPFTDENASGEDTPHIPTHPPTAGSLGLKRPLRYPTPKPLGLPLTARRTPAGGSTDDPNKRQRVDGDDDDDDGPAEVGRWWTDWLCGCREGPNRGGDHQVRSRCQNSLLIAGKFTEPRISRIFLGRKDEPFRMIALLVPFITHPLLSTVLGHSLRYTLHPHFQFLLSNPCINSVVIVLSET